MRLCLAAESTYCAGCGPVAFGCLRSSDALVGREELRSDLAHSACRGIVGPILLYLFGLDLSDRRRRSQRQLPLRQRCIRLRLPRLDRCDGAFRLRQRLLFRRVSLRLQSGIDNGVRLGRSRSATAIPLHGSQQLAALCTLGVDAGQASASRSSINEPRSCCIRSSDICISSQAPLSPEPTITMLLSKEQP